MRELAGLLGAVALVACGGSARDTPEAGRGTAACRQWQDSVCDWAVRCQALDREDCDAQFQGVTCKSDEVARKCAANWDDATCVSTPERCDLDTIADPAPAARACNTLTEEFCQRSTDCGITATEADCLSSESVDCSR